LKKCSKEEKQPWTFKGKRSQVILNCCLNGRVSKSMWIKFSNIKGQWLSQNQEAKDETTRDEFSKNVIRIMATLETKPMPSKKMGRKACWWFKFSLG
jgi:hypothetical protein